MTELDWSGSSNPHLMLEFLASQQARRRWRWFPWVGSQTDRRLERKRLLFALACCRRVEHFVADQRTRQALDIADRYVDGLASSHDWKRAANAATGAAFDASSPRIGVGGWLAAAQARAAEAVAAVLCESDPANVAAARAKDAVRAWAKGVAVMKPKPAADLDSTPPSAPSWNAPIIITGAVSPPAPAQAPTPAPNPTSVEDDAWAKEAVIQCRYLRDIFGNPFRSATLNASAYRKSKAIPLAERINKERAFAQLPEIADVLSADGCSDAELLAHCRQAEEHVHGCWVIDLLLDKSPP